MRFYIYLAVLTVSTFQFGCVPKRGAANSPAGNVTATSTATPTPKTNPAPIRPLKEFTIKIDAVQYSEGQVKVTVQQIFPTARWL